MRWVSELSEVFADLHADPAELDDLGDVILASGHTTARSRAGDVPVDQAWFLAVTFRGGRISHAVFRRTRDEALRAVGLAADGDTLKANEDHGAR